MWVGGVTLHMYFSESHYSLCSIWKMNCRLGERLTSFHMHAGGVHLPGSLSSYNPTPQSMQKRVKQVVGSQCHHSCVQYHDVLMQTALLGMPTCIPSWTFKEVSRKLWKFCTFSSSSSIQRVEVTQVLVGVNYSFHFGPFPLLIANLLWFYVHVTYELA